MRSADSDDMYADLASPVSSASSRSPTPGHNRKERGLPRDRDTNKERGSGLTHLVLMKDAVTAEMLSFISFNAMPPFPFTYLYFQF